MEKAKQEMGERAFALAKKYELEYGNCAQSVVAGVFEALDIENKEVFRAATGFADGVGLTGDGHCGALSGGTLAISYLFGRPKEEFARRGKMMKAFLLSRQLHDRFQEKYGTCRCCEIQTKFFGKFFNLLDENENQAALQAGLPEKCSTLAGDIARLTAELILEQRERDRVKGKKA